MAGAGLRDLRAGYRNRWRGGIRERERDDNHAGQRHRGPQRHDAAAHHRNHRRHPARAHRRQRRATGGCVVGSVVTDARIACRGAGAGRRWRARFPYRIVAGARRSGLAAADGRGCRRSCRLRRCAATTAIDRWHRLRTAQVDAAGRTLLRPRRQDRAAGSPRRHVRGLEHRCRPLHRSH